MKRTSKLVVLLASLALLAGCAKSGDNGGGGNKPKPSDTPNDINVIYVNKYVSDNRAAEIKQGFINSLTASGVSVDAAKINFFVTENSTVAAYADEILAYNASNPNNQVDVILGANGFGNAEEETQTAILEKYQNDGVDYTYGTHTTASYNTTRKFWYDKAKANDTYVKGLQTYLQANWTEVPPPPESGKLTVMGYSAFVSADRFNEIKTGFQNYLAEQQITISTLEFVHETETTTIADFMGKVSDYDTAHPDAPVDVLLGLKTNAAITAAGFSNDGVSYNYGDMGTEEQNNDRRFWYKALTTEVTALQTYMQAHWTPEPPEPENEYYVVGDMTEWNIENPSLKMTKVTDGEYKYEGLEVTANQGFKVFCPQLEGDARWFTNASTWTDCGFTLSDPDKNILPNEAGTYNIHFYVAGENNNHVTIEKQGVDPQPTKFYVGYYDKYIDETKGATLKEGLTAALQNAGVTDTIEFTSLGTGNIGAASANIVTGTTLLLGFNGDSGDALKNLGYAKYSENNYNYGPSGNNEKNRKLWVFDPQEGVEVEGSSAREAAATVAAYNYLEANWTEAQEKEYYVVGDMTEWNITAPTLKMTKVSDNEYKYEGLEVAENQGFKVFCPQLEGDNRWFTDDSTWTDCGFTLSNPDKNVVPNEAGKYTVHFYVAGENNNHITIEKQTVNKFYVGLYDKYITTNKDALVAGVAAALVNAGITGEIEFTSLGTGNVGAAFGNRVAGTTILLGFNGDSNNVMANAGYAKYSDQSYTYGTDTNRKLWILDSARTDAATVAVFNYLEANWKAAA